MAPYASQEIEGMKRPLNIEYFYHGLPTVCWLIIMNLKIRKNEQKYCHASYLYRYFITEIGYYIVNYARVIFSNY